MDQFLAFLSESESLCESAEAEIERNPLMFKVSEEIFSFVFLLRFIFKLTIFKCYEIYVCVYILRIETEFQFFNFFI